MFPENGKTPMVVFLYAPNGLNKIYLETYVFYVRTVFEANLTSRLLPKGLRITRWIGMRETFNIKGR